MAKLMAAVSGSTAAKIEQEGSAILEAERVIAELREQRQRHLTDNDPTAVLEVEDKIAAAEYALLLRQERLAAFEAKLASEQTPDLERRKTEALAAFEQRLAGRVAAAERVESARGVRRQFAGV